MKIQFFSDIHTEDGRIPFQQGDADVVCICGDVGVGMFALDWIDENMVDVNVPILYVPGNHEFYYHNLFEMLPIFEARCYEMGVDFLYNKSIVLNNVLFCGTTLWTDFNLHNNQYNKMIVAPQQLSDYLCIDGANGKLTPQEVLTEHQKAIAFLDEALGGRPEGQQAVVLTHHAPHALSLGKRKNDRYAPFYASNLENLILKHEPELIIHGHIHESVQYFIGDETLVMSNTRGRKSQGLNKQFDFLKAVVI
jgi:predicted phosphodiesterase